MPLLNPLATNLSVSYRVETHRLAVFLFIPGKLPENSPSRSAVVDRRVSVLTQYTPNNVLDQKLT